MDKEYEDKCKRCGQCCRLKISIMGKIFYSDKYCPYLKFEKDNKAVCTVYEDRFREALWCKPITDSIASGIAPQGCMYVPDGYQSKVKDKINLGDV